MGWDLDSLYKYEQELEADIARISVNIDCKYQILDTIDPHNYSMRAEQAKLRNEIKYLKVTRRELKEGLKQNRRDIKETLAEQRADEREERRSSRYFDNSSSFQRSSRGKHHKSDYTTDD